MDGMLAEPLLRARPRPLRQRSHSAATKPSPLQNDAVDSDASKRSSKHRHTQSHHHFPHHPKRFVKDRLGELKNESNLVLSKQASRQSNAPESATAKKGREGIPGLDGAVESRYTTPPPVDGEEVERLVLEEQWKNQKRLSELQSTLHNLSEDSMKTTRRLDDLYYNLLEKLAGLRSTISNLQELAGLTAGLHDQFKEDTSELEKDLTRQIEGFGGFKSQQSQIESVERRLTDSKRKADRLSERMEAAKKRVSALEEREKEWQDVVSWRLRWMWIILGIIGGILVTSVCWHLHIRSSLVHIHTHPQFDPRAVRSSLSSLMNVPTPVRSILEEIIDHSINTSEPSSAPKGAASLSSRISKIMEPTTPVDRDPLLRLFDEL